MNNSVRFTYLRDKHNNRIACIAVAYDPKTRQIAYAISTLNPSDSFDKKIGRELALGRLVQNPTRLTLHIPKHEITAHEITRRILKDLLMWSNDELPQRTRSAAELWIQQSLIKLSKQQNLTSNSHNVILENNSLTS